MPILVKDYYWSESEDTLFISIPLHGVKKSNVDIICSEEFIKASFPPFLFEVLLFKPVVSEKSYSKIKDGCLVFKLVKEEKVLWGFLESSDSKNKALMTKKKQEAIDKLAEKSAKAQTIKSSIHESSKKYSLKEMMKLEEKTSSKIEETKENERIHVEAEMVQWRDVKKVEAEKEKEELFQKLSKPCKEPEISFDNSLQAKNQENKSNQSSTNIFETEKFGPRKSEKINVKFTPRVFPTPQRESKTSEEIEWLQKQASARKRFEINEPDLANHEKDPVWLKDKGNHLYSIKDYSGAINAYNLAIKVQPAMSVLYLNRSACHLQLKNLYKCIEDCSTALDLMKPEVESNAQARLKAHIRRAIGFSKLELYAEALQDYEAAIKIDPKNKNLAADASNLRSLIQSA